MKADKLLTKMKTMQFEDRVRENEQRLRRERLLRQSKQNDKREYWQGLFIAVMVGGSIATLLVVIFFPSLMAAFDLIMEAPVYAWTIFVLAGVAGILIIRSARQSRK